MNQKLIETVIAKRSFIRLKHLSLSLICMQCLGIGFLIYFIIFDFMLFAPIVPILLSIFTFMYSILFSKNLKLKLLLFLILIVICLFWVKYLLTIDGQVASYILIFTVVLSLLTILNMLLIYGIKYFKKKILLDV